MQQNGPCTPRNLGWPERPPTKLASAAKLWAAIESIAPRIGCVPHTLNDGVKRAEVDSGQCPGTTSSDAQRIKELEREVKELRRANDILKTASAFFAQAELDRRLKS